MLKDSRFRSSISSAVFVFFAIQTSLRTVCIQIALFLSCEAPRIALRAPGGVQGTRVKCIHNSSLIFSHLSRTPLTNATSSLSLFVAAPRLSFFSREQSGKKGEREEEGGESFQTVKVACATPSMPKEYTSRALCTPSRRLTYLLVRSLLCSF